MLIDEEHSARVVREHVSAREDLDELLRTAAIDLDPDGEALVKARRRVEAADRAYADDLEARGFPVPHGLRK